MSPEVLRALALPPREQLHAALARGRLEAARCLLRLDRAHRDFEQGFRAWIAAIHAFGVQSRGVDEAGVAVDAGAVLRAARRQGVEAADLAVDSPAEAELAKLSGDALLARFDALAAARLRVHDVYRDWVTALLSHVYRRHGADELEACLRFAGERTLLRWMPRDLARPAEERVRRWAQLLLANFARIRIDEDQEKFTITQDVCASCGRQLQAGCYGAEPRFAIVRERHRVSFGRGDVPVYRTHVAVMHYLLPLERSGVPWPVLLCPAGEAPGPCRLLLYKDPARTPREHWAWLQAAEKGPAARSEPQASEVRGTEISGE